eukprot:CAMPEP_0117686718 /NCGR_PEP_ID=MMETSP0804-20121206/22640_1 /TAXON_ID=1074897 /ORGANISM="Tetraselmis astigmatica, Strain CCMP880" /LENGTH=142 /DNA_ID=CAMNT_0005498511 /DNA_START=580 /DNA_END=1010 /DNA_ORIENTATION=-
MAWSCCMASGDGSGSAAAPPAVPAAAWLALPAGGSMPASLLVGHLGAANTGSAPVSGQTGLQWRAVCGRSLVKGTATPLLPEDKDFVTKALAKDLELGQCGNVRQEGSEAREDYHVRDRKSKPPSEGQGGHCLKHSCRQAAC